MAGETVYCCSCSRRLRGEDFGQKAAFRVDDQVCCSECVHDLIADLPPEEQEAILNPPAPKKTTATRVTAVRTGGTSTNVKAVQGGTAQIRRTTGQIPKADAPQTKTGSVTKVRQTGAIPKTRPTEAIPKARPTEAIPKARQTDVIPKTGSTGRIQTASTGTRSIKRTTTRSIPKAQPPEEIEGEEGAEEAVPNKKKLFLFGGIGAGVLVIGIVVIILLMSGKEAPVAVAVPSPATPVKGAPAKPPTAEEAAKAAMLEALKHETQDPYGEYYRKLKEVVAKGEGTKYAEEAKLAMGRVRQKFDEYVVKLAEDNTPLWQQQLFGNLLAAWEKERTRVEGTDLQETIDQRLSGLRDQIKDRFKNVKNAALDHRRRGNEEAVKEEIAKIAKWEIKEYAEELEKALAEVKAGDAAPAAAANPAAADPAAAEPPKAAPLSPAMLKYVPRWQEAMGKAFVRDFEGAIADLGRAARDIDEDEVKKESSQDQEALRQAMALVEAARSLIPAQTPRFQAVTLEYLHRPGEFRKVTGKVIKVVPQRIELNTEDKEKPRIFVEIADLSAGTLAEYILPKSEKRDADARSVAILCLIEGNVEAAKKHGGRAASKIAERYWSFAKEAREKAPKGNSREFEARDLFHSAESDWREVKTWGPAIEKYRTLKNDYASSRIVRDNQAVIVSRSDVGREYTFFAAPDAGNFALTAASGSTFKLGKHPKMDSSKIDPAWVTKEDIDFSMARDNYIEAEFYALPNTAYRCWVYVGACCQETFAFFYQTTEGIFKDKGKDKAVDPGGRFAAPNLDMPPNLRKEHSDHKPKNPKDPHPKEPIRWEWIQIPLPKMYAGAGPKSVRIITDQAGFGVGYVLIVPESRRTALSEAQTKELAKEAAGGGGGEGAAKVAGAKDPSDWLVAGPFEGALKDAQEPESGIDLGKEMKGKGGAVKWKPAEAALKPVAGGKTAVFDLAKIFPQKDGSTAYVLIHVKAKGPTDAKLFLGHDDALKVWVNGTAVYTGNAAKRIDEATASIKLEEGWNRLLFKVANTRDAWMLSVRVTDPDRRTIEDLEYHTHGDALK